jgi:SAM-dependent methyltransferase
VTDLESARESIELALDPPPPVPLGAARRLVRRVLLRLGQGHARYQQQIDRQLLALIGSLEARLANTDARTEELSARNHSLAEQASALAGRVGEVERHLGPLESLAAELQAVPAPDVIGLERFEAAEAGTVIGYRRATPPVSPEDDYVAFEDVFRLSEDVIRERQRPYLSMLGGRRPVLDAGCGRGEFLELLRDAGVPARGVDLDPGMVSRARTKGVDVEQGDVVAAQVVEHLPYTELLAFLRLAYRKLQPSGLLIAETVNPHAPGTLKGFWTDPTHQHPIFPEVLLTLCRDIGFASAYVFHPGGTGDVDLDRLHRGDYAIVAERGETANADEAASEDAAG